MKSRFRHNILLGLMLVAAFVSLVPTAVFADGASAYLTPASGTAQIGSSFTVSVDGRLGAYWWGGGPSSANGTITFPANLLKVISYDDNTNATFPYSTTTVDNAAGTIRFSQSTAQWTYANANSNAHLLTITFQALVSGTANVQFSSMSYSTGSAATSGGVYTIPAPPAPKPSPTPKPSTSPTPTKPKPSVTPTPTPSVTPSPTPDATPAPTTESDGDLKISNVKVTATRSENSITWSLSNPAATQTVSYGAGDSKSTDGTPITTNDDGSYKLILKDLRPGTLYHFTIKASTSDGLQGATSSGTLMTRGYPVVLTIEQGGLLIPGAKVVIAGRSFVADKDALVTTEVSDGTITAVITPPNSSDGQSTTFVVKKLAVPTSGNPAAQSFTLNIPLANHASGSITSILPALIGGGVAAVTLIGGGVGFLMLRKRRMPAEQTVDIDTGELTEAYGRRLEQPMSNTPEPNLEAEYVNPAMETASNYTDTMPPVSEAEQPAAAPQEQPLPQSTAGFDPSTLPLPTDADTPAPSSAAPSPVVDDNAGIDAQVFGQEINQIEASEQPPSNEPSAVYDEATGELAIIHHHDVPTPSVPATPPAAAQTVASMPEQPPTVQTVAEQSFSPQQQGPAV